MHLNLFECIVPIDFIQLPLSLQILPSSTSDPPCPCSTHPPRSPTHPRQSSPLLNPPIPVMCAIFSPRTSFVQSSLPHSFNPHLPKRSNHGKPHLAASAEGRTKILKLRSQRVQEATKLASVRGEGAVRKAKKY